MSDKQAFKERKTESIFRDWVLKLPFQMQAVLAAAMRGPDGVRKNSSVKPILKFLRGSIAKPAWGLDGEHHCNNDPGAYMWFNFENFVEFKWGFFDDTDGYPMHFLMHLFHAIEILGYKHPDAKVREPWYQFYTIACAQLHMNPETEEELDSRLKY